jgi:hypothetical protein
MKFSDILLEAADPKLLQYLSGNKDYYKVGPDYVFIWTNSRLRELLQNGARMGDAGLGTVATPVKTSDGLGIVSVRTGDVCVGAIDRDYVARWVSSVPNGDPARFFKTIQSRKIRELPTKLQDLGDYYKEESEKGDPTRVTSSGVQKIIDTIQSNDDYENLRDEFDMSEFENMSPSEVKTHLEETIRKMKHREKILRKQVKKINDIIHAKIDELSDEELDRLLEKEKSMGGDELLGMAFMIKEIEGLLKREANLFINDTKEKEKEEDEDEINDTDTENKIDLWMEEFESDFPGLVVRDAYQFDPNI